MQKLSNLPKITWKKERKNGRVRIQNQSFLFLRLHLGISLGWFYMVWASILCLRDSFLTFKLWTMVVHILENFERIIHAEDLFHLQNTKGWRVRILVWSVCSVVEGRERKVNISCRFPPWSGQKIVGEIVQRMSKADPSCPSSYSQNYKKLESRGTLVAIC